MSLVSPLYSYLSSSSLCFFPFSFSPSSFSLSFHLHPLTSACAIFPSSIHLSVSFISLLFLPFSVLSLSFISLSLPPVFYFPSRLSSPLLSVMFISLFFPPPPLISLVLSPLYTLPRLLSTPLCHSLSSPLSLLFSRILHVFILVYLILASITTILPFFLFFILVCVISFTLSFEPPYIFFFSSFLHFPSSATHTLCFLSSFIPFLRYEVPRSPFLFFSISSIIFHLFLSRSLFF